MEATAEAPIDAHAPARKGYSSRPGALIWFFRKSRDEWKAKCSGAHTSIHKVLEEERLKKLKIANKT